MAEDEGAPRFPRVTLSQMTPQQREVAMEIWSGPRRPAGFQPRPDDHLTGPFNAWLQSPETAARLQRVGEHLRFSSSLPTRLNELAILICARHWTAQFEWYAHHRLALQAGLDPKIAEDLAAGRRPQAMAEDEACVFDFCTELRADRQVSDATFARTVGLFGHAGVIDLIAVSGYYDLVSMTLNVARVSPPGGDPLKPL